jgi:hypothetical protein
MLHLLICKINASAKYYKVKVFNGFTIYIRVIKTVDDCLSFFGFHFCVCITYLIFAPLLLEVFSNEKRYPSVKL